MSILKIVSQHSVSVVGGSCPYPIHNMCDKALNNDHAYCVPGGASIKSSLKTQDPSGKCSSLETKNWIQPFQCATYPQNKCKYRNTANGKTNQTTPHHNSTTTYRNTAQYTTTKRN
eukprot:m.72032 g.72032  ORF g.72032 m.72032 type:complete len:116 (-) comp24419_c0_seq1:35-382(-)